MRQEMLAVPADRPEPTILGREDPGLQALAVAMHEDALPNWMPHPKNFNRDVPPQCWGMRLAQLKDIIASFSNTRVWSRWIQEKGYANLYD